MSGRISHRFARVILWCYPSAWRHRYADEVRTLLDESPSGWRVAVDLGAGAVREWVSPSHVAWPTTSTLGWAQGMLMLTLYGAALGIAWVSQSIGEALGATGWAPSENAGTAAALAWMAVSLWLLIGVVRSAIHALRHGAYRDAPARLGTTTLITLALVALVAGVLGGSQLAPRFWLQDLMPYLRNFSLAGLASMRSARMARLGRIQMHAARRRRRHRLHQHVGPRLDLGDGPVGGMVA